MYVSIFMKLMAGRDNRVFKTIWLTIMQFLLLLLLLLLLLYYYYYNCYYYYYYYYKKISYVYNFVRWNIGNHIVWTFFKVCVQLQMYHEGVNVNISGVFGAVLLRLPIKLLKEVISVS